MAMPIVDLVVLSRRTETLDSEVESGVCEQRGVHLIVHRVVGTAEAGDFGRCETIARARNEGKSRGSSPWLMFLDDDVVLAPDCVVTLLGEMIRRPTHGALAADYLGERRERRISRHVAMGATLFRRSALKEVHFKARRDRCECQCCCDELRLRRWAIDYCEAAVAKHLPYQQSKPRVRGACGGLSGRRVSCLCVTSHRVSLLRRAVQCFLEQTYPERELVVVYPADDFETGQYLARVRQTSILAIEVPAGAGLTLGALRNLARESATGAYVATWDDDDWHGPERLAAQMQAIAVTGKAGCALARLVLFDRMSHRAYVSSNRPWENSLIVERSTLPTYPDLARGEDTPVVADLVRRGELVLLDRPDMYVYSYHGGNTWNRGHWEQLIRYSLPLDAGYGRRVAALFHGGGRNSASAPA